MCIYTHDMKKIHTRIEAANACVEILDTDFFRALSEPVRVQIFRTIILNGRSDVGAISKDLPQDRSVIARHLQTMERAGLVHSQTEGRHTYYEIAGENIVTRIKSISDLIHTLVPLCC